jgi:hypothetical protein
MTFMPGEAGKIIKAVFDNGAIIEGTYDFLYAYNGNTTSATQFAGSPWSNSTGVNIGTLVASNPDGAITFKFTSDYSVAKAGWRAVISCELPSGVADIASRSITLSPNPNTGEFTVNLNGLKSGKSTISVYNINGQMVYQNLNASAILNVDLSKEPRGIYFVKISSAGETFNQKVVLY